MESIQTAVLSACMIALGLTLAEGILPMERFGRQIRTLFVTLLLIGMLRPLIGMDVSFPDAVFSVDGITEELTAAADAARSEAVSACIQSSLQEQLDAHHVACEILEVTVHIQEDGGIVIDEVLITGSTLTGTIYLREWLGDAVAITAQKEESK